MSPNKSLIIPKLVRILEAAIIAAFFILVSLLLLYYWLKRITERYVWPLMLITPIRTFKNK